MTAASPHTNQWVTRETLGWLLVAQGVAILPLFIYLPIWTPLVWIGVLFWRIQIFRGAWPFPSNKVKFLLGMTCIIGLLLSYAGTIGVEPLVAFLVISFVLKLVEARSRNDVLLIIYVGFIAVAAQFLFFQTMLMAIYGCLSVIFILCAWNCIYRSQSVSVKRQFSSSVVLFFQSIPLMLLFFIVLPRLGTLWHVPIPQSTGVTGFSDSMSPGDFTSLSKSRRVAFRVSFEGDSRPARNNWYWRGLVLENFDGRKWEYNDNQFFRRTSTGGIPDFWYLSYDQNAQFYRYNVLMEPHQQQWLFTLMAPVDVNSSSHRLFFTPEYLTKSSKPIASRSQYLVTSSDQYLASPDKLSERVKLRNLRLPARANPRTVALAQEWRQSGQDNEAIINRALSLYRDSFTYTLNPPPLGTNSADEFLFITKRGFCEHFSSSFVVLMRAAGIPARVVVGYQGGELNPIENYIIVRQSDAHAWAEVWLKGRGWVRVDPTSAVSPLRIEQGLEQSLSENEKTLIGSFAKGSWANYFQLRIDALSYSWHQWVLGYDARRQAGVFENLFGGTEVWRIGAIFIGCITSFLMLYFFWLTWRGRAQYEYPEQAVYARFLKRMHKKGFIPASGESPLAFAKRVGTEKPEWAKDVQMIANLYVKIAYEEKQHLITELRQRVASMQLH